MDGNIIPIRTMSRRDQLWVKEVRPPSQPNHSRAAIDATEGRDGTKTVISRTMVSKTFDAGYWDKLARLDYGENFSNAARLEPLPDGPGALKARLDLIRNAKSSIVLGTYELGDDAETFQILDALTERARAGLAVAIRFDGPIQSMALLLYGTNKEALMDRLRSFELAGGCVLMWGGEDDQPFAEGNHTKLLLADGKHIITGGRNTRRCYFGEWNDFEIAATGLFAARAGEYGVRVLRECQQWQRNPATLERVGDIIDRIELDLARSRAWHTDELIDRAARGERVSHPFMTLTWSPHRDPGRVPAPGEVKNPLTQALIESVKRAKKEIIIESNYVNPTPELEAALIAAAKRGVEVHVIGTGRNTTDSAIPYVNTLAHSRALHEAGVKVYETSAKRSHVKLFMFDGELAAFGSYNMEVAADVHLAEQLHFTTDQALVAEMRQAVDRDLKNATRFSPDQFSFWERIKFFFIGLIAWFFADKV